MDALSDAMNVNFELAERKRIGLLLLNDQNFNSLLGRLCDRWSDEKLFENIDDYAAPLKKYTDPIGVSIVRMNKRPFGFNAKINGQQKIFTIFLKKKGNYYQAVLQLTTQP